LEENQRSCRRRAGRADRVADEPERVGDVGVNGRGELRNTRLEHALGEIVELHGELGGREVDADVLLAGDGERGVLLVVVLHLKRRAVRDQRAVGQTDAEGGADLGAFDRERIVIITFRTGRYTCPRLRGCRFHGRSDYIFRHFAKFDQYVSLTPKKV
jgi:hypothetical protein